MRGKLVYGAFFLLVVDVSHGSEIHTINNWACSYDGFVYNLLPLMRKDGLPR